MTIWLYRISDIPESFEVGFYTPTGGWNVVEVYQDQGKARASVNYLNGGSV